MKIDNIIDISHWESVDWNQMKAGGIKNVIAKCSQGLTYVDPKYYQFHTAAAAQGMAWGSYHFGDGSDPIAQCVHYVTVARITDADLVCLDFEPNPHGPSMTLAQAKEWVMHFIKLVGRPPVIYGGHWLKELMQGPDAVLNQCPLWLAQYGSKAVLPPGWDKYTLWQYTDGNVGPNPHSVPGIGPCDRSIFDGDQKELDAAWPFTKKPGTVPTPTVPDKKEHHFAIYSISDSIPFRDVQRIADSCHAQMTKDFYPIWQRKVSVIACQKESDVPLGYFKVIIKDTLSQDGALGYHTDEHGQPVCYILAQDLEATCVTCSHEILEAEVDAFGNRFIVCDIQPYGKVRVLVEIADPPESYAYADHGLPVSDFITPEWYDEVVTPRTRYSFKGHINKPQTILNGGYFSFLLPNGQWMQRTNFDGTGDKDEGPFAWQRQGAESMREMVDRETRARRSQSTEK